LVCTLPLLVLAEQSPYPFWLDRAPWPPSLLRQAPTATLGHGSLFSPEGILNERLYPRGSRVVRGPLYNSPFDFITAVVAPRPAWYASYPCPISAWTVPPGPPTVPAPRFPLLIAVGRDLPFARCYPGSRHVLFPLTGPQLVWAYPQIPPRLWLRDLLGLQATPVLYGRTEPPGRRPSCARIPSQRVFHRAS